MALLWLLFAGSVGATLFSVGAATNELALRWLGDDVTAAVSSIYERPDSVGGYNRIARYTYTLPGDSPRGGTSEMAWSEWHRLTMPLVTAAGRPEQVTFPSHAPAELVVRAYAIGPLAYSRAVEHDLGKLYLAVSALSVATFGFLAFAVYLTVRIRPRRRLRIVTHGVAVAGTVLSRRASHSKHGSQYYVRYTFVPAGAANSIITTTWVPSEVEHDAAIPGTAVTVLHDADKPKRSTIYEYSGFRCV